MSEIRVVPVCYHIVMTVCVRFSVDQMFIQDQRDVGEEHEEILCKRVVIRGTPVGSNSGNSQSQLTPLCFGCGLPVQERFYLVAAEQSWHIECLKCSVCDIKLETEITCFAKDGEIYCKDDYHR